MAGEVDKIKAVYLEVIDKDITFEEITTSDVIRASFAGIYMREGDNKEVEKFVILSNDAEKTLDIFNIMYYNIATIEVVNEGCSDLWFANNDTKDQEKAFKIVSDLLAHMQKFKRVTQDESMIDLGSYKQDKALLSKKASEHVTYSTYGAKKKPVVTTGNGVFNTYTAPARSTYAYTPAKTSVKKKAKPTAIKRKRGASRAMLEQMYTAVQEIAEGKYKPAKFPVIPEVENNKEENVTNKTEEPDWYTRNDPLALL